MSNEKVVTLDDAEADKPKGKEKAQIVRAATVDVLGGEVRLVIGEGPDDLGKEPVDIGVNGKVWRIKRNEEVVVPASVYEVIRNAKTTVYTSTKEGVVERDVHRFSFQVVGSA